jgi:hypothetical protein
MFCSNYPDVQTLTVSILEIEAAALLTTFNSEANRVAMHAVPGLG